MLPAANKGVGMNMGFPDVCATPTPVGPIPIPYPNLAMNAQAASFSTRVRLSMVNALNLSSRIPMTMGDEAGTAHPMFKQAGAYTTGNPKVQIESVPAICLLCPTTGNNMNNPVGAVLVPSVTNVFFTYAGPEPRAPARDAGAAVEETGDPYAREMTLDDIEDLARAIASVGADRPPVESWMEGEGVGVIRIHVFSADVPGRVFCAIRALDAQGMKELLIDLKGCPGGDLMAAVELAGDFLPAGSEIAVLVDAEGDETVFRGGKKQSPPRGLTILVDAGTASAAEVFVQALTRHGRARVEGGPTHGKLWGKVVPPTSGECRRSATTSTTRPHGWVDAGRLG